MDDPADGDEGFVDGPDEGFVEDPFEGSLDDAVEEGPAGESAGATAADPDSPAREDRAGVEWILSLLGPRIDDARSLFDEVTSRWRGDAQRLGEGTRQRLQDLFREIGLVTEDKQDDLELRVAQLEHRLSLLEDKDETPPV